MKTSQIKKGLVDAALFAGFILTFFMDLTGLELHQLIGTAAGLLVAYHLIIHWEWVKAVGSRFFGGTSSQSRLYYLIDAIMLGGFFTILGTGFVISSWLNLSLTNYEVWHAAHVAASIITLLTLVLKIAVHWRWIAITARKLFARPAVPQVEARPVVQMNSRREFIKVMGVTGAAAAIALAASLNSLKESSAQASQTGSASSADGLAQADVSSSAVQIVPTTQSISTVQAAPTAQGMQVVPTAVPTTQAAANTNTAACTVRCGRRCSYPGHCRRYTDANGNGRCDFGECM